MNQHYIHLLEPLLANQIAAGEVVERPSSIVKECIENSIDAKAKNIHIEILQGGLDYIKIIDDGQGIFKNDLERAFLRHATSKIFKCKDLAAIQSMGFRGEALASISAVSRCRLISKPIVQQQAWEIIACPDRGISITPSAHPNGTTISIEALFFNIPARRRFLKSASTEFSHIEKIFKKIALAHPTIGFTLSHNHKKIASYLGDDSSKRFLNRIKSVCGASFLQNSCYIDASIIGARLFGWIGVPPFSSKFTDTQYFYVNGRPIRDRVVGQAIREAFLQHPDSVPSAHPCYVLYLEVPFGDVDVNVHPSKHEVRFVQTRLIFDFIQQTIWSGIDNKEKATSKPSLPSTESVTSYSKCYNTSLFKVSCLPKKIEKTVATFTEEENALPIAGISSFFVTEKNGKLFAFEKKKVVPALLELYFSGKYVSIISKPLLFPENISIPSEVFAKLSDRWLEALSVLGFMLQKLSDSQKLGVVKLIKQPIIFTDILTSEDVVEMMRLDDMPTWIKAQNYRFSLEKLAAHDLHELLQNFVMTTTPEPVLQVDLI